MALELPGSERAGAQRPLSQISSQPEKQPEGTNRQTAKNTLREAKETAKSLRKQGLWVIIIGPDGKTIDDEPAGG